MEESQGSYQEILYETTATRQVTTATRQVTVKQLIHTAEFYIDILFSPLNIYFASLPLARLEPVRQRYVHVAIDTALCHVWPWWQVWVWHIKLLKEQQQKQLIQIFDNATSVKLFTSSPHAWICIPSHVSAKTLGLYILDYLWLAVDFAKSICLYFVIVITLIFVVAMMH